MFLAKSILRALIHDIDIGSPFHGENPFIRFVWGRFPAGLGNYAVRLLASQQFFRQI